MMEQVTLSAVWPMENWLGSSLNHIQGSTIVPKSYSRALEQGPLPLNMEHFYTTYKSMMESVTFCWHEIIPEFVSFPPTRKWQAGAWRHDSSQRSEKYPRRGFRQRRRCCTKLTDLIVIGSGDVARLVLSNFRVSIDRVQENRMHCDIIWCL